jgi:hypothetical protein
VVASRKQFLIQILTFVGLYSFSVSHPILELVSGDLSFFLYHRADGRLILLYWLIVALVSPLLFFASLQLLRLVGAGIYRFGYSVCCTILAILFICVSLNSTFRELNLALFVSVALIFTILFIGLFRTQAGAKILAALSCIALVSAWQFFISSDVSQMYETQSFDNGDGTAYRKLEISKETLVFVLVFDELATVSLLDDLYAIDSRRFPNFSKLAAHSHWYRNASTVSVATAEAIPSIVTGVYPLSDEPPTSHSYPNNIISLFSKIVDSQVFEPVTKFEQNRKTGEYDTLVWVLLDSAVVYLHLTLPTKWRSQLPSIEQKNGDFLDSSIRIQQMLSRVPRWEENQGETRVEEFRRFIGNIKKRERIQFYYAHILFPHVPWNTTSSFKMYAPDQLFGHNMDTEYWLENEHYVLQNYQRYLLQVSATDRLLGEFLDRLKDENIYDTALIIVTADHGVSFHPLQHRRSAELVANPAEIINVPLFVKLPGQRDAAVSDENVESIDIAPTLAEVLGFELPWVTDGSSVFDERASSRPRKRVLSYDWSPREDSTHRSKNAWLEYAGDQIGNIKKSVDYKFAHLVPNSSFFQFDTSWSINARHTATKLIESGNAISEGEIFLTSGSLTAARESPENFAISRIVGEVVGVSPNSIVVMKLDGNDRLEVAPVIHGEFSLFIPETTYDKFVSGFEIYIMEDIRLLKPQVSW